MKKGLVIMGVALAAAAAAAQRPAGWMDRAGLAQFLASFVERPGSLPFSFRFDGKASADLLPQWKASSESKPGAAREMKTVTYRDPRTGLRMTIVFTIDREFPAVEWVARFKNEGTEDTPLIEDVLAGDLRLDGFGTGEVLLHRARGSNAERTDFAPIQDVLNPGGEIRFEPTGGRSSDTGALPFFNLAFPGRGVMAAIGWSGGWKALLRRTAEGAVTLQAGMTETRFRLHPGEEVRTPSVALLFWKGADRLDGHNLFRRWILARHSPKPGGKPLVLPLASGVGFGGPLPCNEYMCATESHALAMVERLGQFGIVPDACWIDAGWYENAHGSWWQGVGNWTVDRARFPNGLKPVTAAAKRRGQGFVLWFEPERVYEGTWLDREHPEWLTRLPGDKNRLLNLGDSRALEWLIGRVDGLIKSEGITIYRQDFNFRPAPYWKAMDGPDRVGVAEMKHIAGLYAFWDALLERNPGLLIDNCASGGRRIDLETTSRSVPLWRTDYQYYEPNGYQCHTYGLHFFLPASGTGNGSPTRYNFRSAMGGALVFGWEFNGSFNLPLALEDVAEYKAVRAYFLADYYPLTEYSTSDEAWAAFQWDRPEEGDGIVLAFRRPQAPSSSLTIRLHALEPEADYELSYEDYGITQVKSGRELAQEWAVKIADAPGSLLIRYRRVR